MALFCPTSLSQLQATISSVPGAARSSGDQVTLYESYFPEACLPVQAALLALAFLVLNVPPAPEYL